MIKNLQEKLNQYLGYSDSDLDDFVSARLKGKKLLMYVVIVVGAIFLAIWSLLSYQQEHFTIFFIDIASSLFLVYLFFYLRRTNKLWFVSYFVVGMFSILLEYINYSGGLNNNGFLWSLCYPVGVVFFYGRKRGTIIALIFLLITALVLFTAPAYQSSHIDFQLRYISVYIVILMIAWAFETSRNFLEERIINNNLKLQNTIRELKAKDEALQKAKSEAETADRLKSEFLAQMSHEIRTPINTILNFSSLVEFDVKDKVSGNLDGCFDSIKNASGRLIRTVDLILDLSAIEAGAYKPKFEILDIYESVLVPVVHEFSAEARKNGLELKLINDAGKPELEKLDKYSFTQILSNLLSNALKYTKKGGVIVNYTLQNDKPEIQIVDTGIGISERYLPELFNKFSQETQGYTRSFEGNGLGLTIVKKYCEINKISIDVYSTPGIGTTFTLKLKKAG